MTATVPDLKPLPLASLPAAVQKLLAGPAAMKAMAAKGIAPLRPGELLTAVYQLSFDAEPSVRAAAEAASLPDKILAPALAEPLPPEVLQFFAGKLAPDRIEPLEKILYNPATSDGTFVLLARRLRERELEVIFQNEARLLRTPAILEALYGNPEARMSSVNRAIELCVRNGVKVDGIPSFDEVAKSISQDPEATAEPATIDQMFSTLLSVADNVVAAAADEPAGQAAPAAEPPGQAPPAAPEEKSKRKSPIIDFTRLKLYEKIRLATLGNEYCRSNLLRDPNRMVAMAAIRSPRITDSEILKAASNRSVCEDVIRYIANQRDLTKNYQVKLSLVNNPKCPVALSLKYLPLLNADDLKQVAKSKNIPGALSTGARRLLQNRKAE